MGKPSINRTIGTTEDIVTFIGVTIVSDGMRLEVKPAHRGRTCELCLDATAVYEVGDTNFAQCHECTVEALRNSFMSGDVYLRPNDPYGVL